MNGPFVDAMERLSYGITDFIRNQGKDWSDVDRKLRQFRACINKEVTKERNRLLLYPDMSRTTYDGSETFVFAAPCSDDEWNKLLRHPNCLNDGTHLPYLTSGEGEDQVCIILRRHENTDDECVETAAWIRVTLENFGGIIYAMTHVTAPQYGSIAQIIARTAGANPKQVKHIDIEETS